MRLRLPPLPYYIKMGEALGVNPITTSFDELFTALEQKVADGQDNPYPTDRASKFYEVQSYILESNHMFSGNIWIINERLFQSLPQDYREILLAAVKEATDFNWELSIKKDQEDKKWLQEKGGMKVIVPNAIFKKQLRDSQKSVYEWLFMELLVFLLSLMVLLPLGIPIAIVLILSAVILMLFMGNFDALIVGQEMFMGTSTFVLMAIPFFVLAGEIMTVGGLSRRIVDFANILVGRVRGGLGYAAVLGSIIFSGLSDSPIADTAALGAILIPLMAENGYRVDRSTGLICAGGIIAAIIPPSIPMIVLGAVVGVSISRLFMAGLVPGIILGLALMAPWRLIVQKDQYNDIRTPQGRREKSS